MTGLGSDLMAVIAALISYPIKGCAGVHLERATVEPTGLPQDRAFMVVDDRGVARTQRRDPRLATLRPAVSADGRSLVVGAPGAAEVQVEVDLDSARRDVEMFGVPHPGIDQGDEVAAWLSEVLDAPSRLVRVPPERRRVADGWVSGLSHYADSSAVHLIAQASLDELNARLAGRGEPPAPMERFRPNVVVAGWPEPHLEDRIRWMTAGRATLAYAKLAIRCAVPMVDQRTGAKDGPEPLRTLATYRRAARGGLALGIKLSVVEPGELAVGDEVRVDSWGGSEL